MVHSRNLDGEELVFGNQGALWGRAMTWWDHGTGSVWSQPIGEAIAGPLQGARLDLVPSRLTTWGEWLQSHPETVALEAPDRPSGFDLDSMSIVVELGEESIAFPVRSLRSAVANEVVGGAPIAVVVAPDLPDTWTVFSRTVDDRVLTFEFSGSDLVDRETGTVWDPVRGIGVSGELQGVGLDVLPGFTSFVEDYWTFYRNGRLWAP